MRDTRSLLSGALRAGAVALSLLLAAPPPAPAYADDDDNSGEYVPGEVVLQLKDGADLGGVAGAFGLALPPLDQFGSRPIYRLRTAGT